MKCEIINNLICWVFGHKYKKSRKNLYSTINDHNLSFEINKFEKTYNEIKLIQNPEQEFICKRCNKKVSGPDLFIEKYEQQF